MQSGGAIKEKIFIRIKRKLVPVSVRYLKYMSFETH